VILPEQSRNSAAVRPNQPEQEVLRVDRIAAELRRVVTREEDGPSSRFRVALKHNRAPESRVARAYDTPGRIVGLVFKPKGPVKLQEKTEGEVLIPGEVAPERPSSASLGSFGFPRCGRPVDLSRLVAWDGVEPPTRGFSDDSDKGGKK